MDETIEIKVTSDLAGKRLDVILAEQCDDCLLYTSRAHETNKG